MLTDRYGLTLTTNSSLAREAYVQAIDLLLSANAGVDDALQQALAADPGFALAQVAQARWLQLKSQLPAAREAADRAATLAQTASHREQQHIEIFRLYKPYLCRFGFVQWSTCHISTTAPLFGGDCLI